MNDRSCIRDRLYSSLLAAVITLLFVSAAFAKALEIKSFTLQ